MEYSYGSVQLFLFVRLTWVPSHPPPPANYILLVFDDVPLYHRLTFHIHKINVGVSLPLKNTL
jgi:hypothetical protein